MDFDINIGQDVDDYYCFAEKGFKLKNNNNLLDWNIVIFFSYKFNEPV